MKTKKCYETHKNCNKNYCEKTQHQPDGSHTPMPEDYRHFYSMESGLSFFVKHPVDGSKIVRAVNSHEALLEAAKLGLQEAKDTLEVVGGCDHSVNVCSCETQRRIEIIQAAISQAEAKEGK